MLVIEFGLTRIKAAVMIEDNAAIAWASLVMGAPLTIA